MRKIYVYIERIPGIVQCPLFQDHSVKRCRPLLLSTTAKKASKGQQDDANIHNVHVLLNWGSVGSCLLPLMKKKLNGTSLF